MLHAVSVPYLPDGSQTFGTVGIVRLVSFAKKLRAARERAGKTQQDIAELFGIDRAAVAQWEADAGLLPTADKLPRLASALKTTIDDLFDRRALNQPAASYSVADGPDIQRRVPLISWVRAGQFDEPVDNFPPGEAEDWYPIPKRAGPNTYALRVEGDSMTAPYGRSYPSGCIIFVDPDRRSPANGQRVIAKLSGSSQVTFKVFVQDAGTVFLRALNQNYPPITERFKVLGTVIGKWEDD